MAIFESVHPLGQELETIESSLLVNLDRVADELPEELAINFEDAMSSGIGVSTLRVANWATKNQAALYYPLAVEADDPNWLVGCEDGFTKVNQRIYVVDMLGRGFTLELDNEVGLSSYLQFDVIHDGIVLSYKQGSEVKTAYGEFESSAYDTFAGWADDIACVKELAQVAQNT